MDYSANSISNTISKISVDEEMSLVRASMEDAASRLTDGLIPDAITNEEIQNGDEILETYLVSSNAIHGGMGSVWRVHHRNWDVDLAMKRPQPRFFAEGSARRKADFIAECENWIDLGLHPNIVSCYYVRDVSGVPSIFSEWMENGSLKDCIRDGSVYAGTGGDVEERLLDIAIQFANGLHYAHEAGLLHQDVKPDNLLLNRDWEAKVADFGLAQARVRISDRGGETDAGPGREEGILSSGYTPAYCSPEQKDGKNVGRSTDIYSWAASVLELFLGERLWESGPDAGKNWENYAGKSRVPMPTELERLLRQCLDPDPLKRPRDFSSVITELQNIYRTQTGSEYVRTETGKAAATADSLNNRALSYLDLGKPEEAEKCWAEALKQNGGHAESAYNRSLMQWRDCKISDLDVLTSLENCRRDPNCVRLLARIELERGNPEGVSDMADEPEIQAASALPALQEQFEKTGGSGYQDFFVAPDGSICQIPWQNSVGSRTQAATDRGVGSRTQAATNRAAGSLTQAAIDRAAESRTQTAIDPVTGTRCFLARSAGGEYELRIEDLRTEKKIRSVPVQEALHPVFFSGDGRRLFTREKAVLDIRSGAVIKNLQDIPVLPSPDGRIFAARYDRPDKPAASFAVIYDTETMEPLRIMKGTGFQEGVLYTGTEEYRTTAAFSPDGRALYLGDERFIHSLNTETGADTLIADDLDGFPFRLAVSPDGTLIAATQRRGILLLDKTSGRHLRTIPLDSPAAAAFFGDRIAIAQIRKGSVPECSIVSVNTPVFTYHAGWALSRIRTTRQQIENERRFASGLAGARDACDRGNYKEALRLLDSVRRMDGMENDPRALSLNRMIGENGIRTALESAFVVRELSLGKRRCYRAVFSGDGSRLLCHCGSEALLIDTETGDILHAFPNSGMVNIPAKCNDLAIDHAGKNVLFGGACLYDAETGKARGVLQGIDDTFFAARFTPDGSRAAVVCKDETLRIYRTADCALETEIVIGPLPVYDLAFMPDGDILLANAHEDREIEMISVSRKKIVDLMETPDFYAETAGAGGGYRNVPEAKVKPSGIQVLFRRINASPDGKRILLEGDDFRCLTMDYDTRALAESAADRPVIRRAVYTGWGSQVLRVEGELLIRHAGSIVSASWKLRDTKVSIAPSLKADAELVLRYDRNGLIDIAASPNGRFAAIVPDNGSILLYELNWKYEIKPAENRLMNRLFHVFSGRKKR